MRKVVIASVVALIGVLSFVCGDDAHAAQSHDKHFIAGDNTFFVYAKAGEKIGVEFLRSGYEQDSYPDESITVTVDGPGEETRNCILSSDLKTGEGCVFKAMPVTKSGVWAVQFMSGKTARKFAQVSPDVRWVKDLFSWKITVNAGGDEIKGRVWSDRYSFRQPPNGNATSDFTTFYVSEDGYVYKAINRQYNGQLSALSADSIGIRKETECISAYQSVDVGNGDYSPALGTCGNRYKLFFEEPSGSLPSEAVRWDDKRDWIRPSIKRPTISELHFVQEDTDDQLSGDITFYLRNFIGQYQIKIDTDNDGSFDGQNDVILYQQMKGLSSNLQRVHFQGVDKKGQILFPSETIGIKVEISKVAEIHFVAADVEGRGGIELVRLNGDNAPNERICWNDNELTPITNSTFATSELDGRSCPVSTGGVHGWLYNNNSWGNARYIDDWIYATAKLSGDNTIQYPENAAEQTQNGQQNWLPLLTAIVVIIIASILIAVAVVMLRKPKKNGPGPGPTPPTPPTNMQPPTPPTYPGGTPPVFPNQ